MSQDFKQCPNGHYYQGDHCPYCKSGGANAPTSQKTEIYGNQEPAFGGPALAASPRPTETVGPGMSPGAGAGYGSGGAKTTVVEGGGAPMGGAPMGGAPMGGAPMGGFARPQQPMGGATPSGGRTVFGDENEFENVGGQMQRVFRETRKLVGWLVSYTIDPMGVDFKLYEGRNIIGRDMDCNITVNDNMVSSKHAVLLFRAGKYSITDSQSSHGTFVNDVDIELEPYYLQDGDVIKMGQTLFKFRSSF